MTWTKVMHEDVWYFGYGSNLDSEQKERRTGPIREAHRACADGYRLAFNKQTDKGMAYANIVPDSSCSVWGVIFRCSPEALARMDSYEGVAGGHYERTSLEVEADDGDRLTAVTYVAGPRYLGSERKPPPDYLQRILMGARGYHLPNSYVEFIKSLGS